ncbi:splicing factor 3B subunit 10 [Oesophagostomum dentatum]|uniref:Splicing factor 3B subunit 10 n=1 Tax=Oesophagostomum dentatum TaxID=61180 RepID=A0A0B1SAA4_OESDE|nr:splicing factor 3B subunit 10 [Oesophagostomum dentatum]
MLSVTARILADEKTAQWTAKFIISRSIRREAEGRESLERCWTPLTNPLWLQYPMSHPGMTSFIAIVENESRARTRYNLLNRMILPCGPPPEKSPLDD